MHKKGLRNNKGVGFKESQPLIFVRSKVNPDKEDMYQIKFADMMGVQKEGVWIGQMVNYELVKYKLEEQITL
jgi:hypothetical protein